MTNTTAPGEGVSRAWLWIGIAGILFALSVIVRDGEALWKSDVLFDCPPLGDGLYVKLDPHERHNDCVYFGPPVSGNN